jgi:hypothetical protein
MRKKTHALTVRLNPKAKAMYKKLAAIGGPSGDWAAIMLATCVPAYAKKRNRKVPTNSPRKAMKWLRTVAGIHDTPGSARGSGGCSEGWGCVKGRMMGMFDARALFMIGSQEYRFDDRLKSEAMRERLLDLRTKGTRYFGANMSVARCKGIILCQVIPRV